MKIWWITKLQIFRAVFLKIAYLLCKRERKQSRLPICVVDSRDC